MSVKWQELGDTAFENFRRELKGTPLDRWDTAMYETAKGKTVLLLAQLYVESRYQTNGRLVAANNPLGLRPGPRDTRQTINLGDKGDFLIFPTPLDAVKEWMYRLTSPDYKGGVYVNTETVEEFVHVYAPASDGNNEAEYVALIHKFYDRLGGSMSERVITYKRVKHPTFDDLPVKKLRNGAGYREVPARQIVGTCVHATYGYGTPEWYQEFFGIKSDGTKGERHDDALVDYYIDRDGTIARFNDPRGTRSPYANGGSDGLEGDGVDYVRRFGANAINDRLVSIETEGKEEGMTPVQLEMLAQLVAYWHDQAGVPWDKFPLHPAFGVVTQMQHYEFATKNCPFAGVKAQTNQYQNRARAIMKAAQIAETDPVTPPPTPVEPYRPPLNLLLLTQLFGTLVRTFPDGRKVNYKFDPKGAISNAWFNRSVQEKQYPAAGVWYSLPGPGGDLQEFVTFVNGWVLYRMNERSGFQWA